MGSSDNLEVEAANRRRTRRGVPTLLWLALVVGSVAGGALPFVVDRNDSEWADFLAARERAGLPLEIPHEVIQLNVDQPDWLMLSADFPSHYALQPYRTNRPVYPAIVSGFCRMVNGVHHFGSRGLSALSEPCGVRKAYVASIITNWLILLGSVLVFFHLLVFLGLHPETATLAAGQIALSPLVLWNLAEASPDLALLLIVGAGLWVFSLACLPKSDRGRSTGWLLLGGAILGVMMLLKAHYDILAVGWLVLIALRKYREAMLLFVGHVVILAAWLALVQLVGWEFRNPELSHYRQGLWIFESFLDMGLPEQLETLASHGKDYLRSTLMAFGPVVLLFAVVGFTSRAQDQRVWAWLTGVVIAVNWLFLFAIRRPFAYLVSAIFIIVYPLAAEGARIGIDILRTHTALKRTTGQAAYLLLATAAAWALSKPWNYDWIFF